MPGRVCEFCGVVYPPGSDFLVCDICGGETVYTAVRAPTYVAEVEPDPTDDLPFPWLNAPLDIREETIVIDSRELIRRGYLARLQPGQVFRVEIDGSDFYIEVVAYSYKDRLYVVREFQTTAPDYVPESWEEETSQDV